MKYSELISRHREYIPKKLQDKIKKCRVLFIGCGLGSQIALLATRVGFSNFILVDGDTVDAHNLNRQGFSHEHLGHNKAEVLAKMIRAINPQANIEVYSIFLKDELLTKKLVNRSDIVINMADPASVMYLINDYSQEKGKPVFFPLNIMWGGYVLIFTKNSARLRDILGAKKITGHSFYFRLLEKSFSQFPPKTLKFYEKMGKKITKMPYLPQLGTAAYLTSSIVVSGMIKWLSNEPLRLAPTPIFLDIWEEIG